MQKYVLYIIKWFCCQAEHISLNLKFVEKIKNWKLMSDQHINRWLYIQECQGKI